MAIPILIMAIEGAASNELKCLTHCHQAQYVGYYTHTHTAIHKTTCKITLSVAIQF